MVFLFGWGGGNVVEPLTVVEEYSAEWSKPLIKLDLKELARLRVQEGFTIKKLADHFGVGTTTIFKGLRKSVRGGKAVSGL